MRPEPHVAFVGLGSNLGDSMTEIRRACAQLALLPGTALARCSAVYRTAPFDVRPQPDFLNACCRLVTTLTPVLLLEGLMRIERDRGRVRRGKGEPRTLDLDLLLYDDVTYVTPGLTLPHPRLHERAFVLYPLADLDAGLVIPGRGPLRVLLERCARQRIERLEVPLSNVPGPGDDHDQCEQGA
ncbi:MAG: 2-amino-4-hydroxy-6-hydroxymethyldihydropteridine diphosphokinase [Acidiferrobacteraceae bacterium]